MYKIISYFFLLLGLMCEGHLPIVKNATSKFLGNTTSIDATDVSSLIVIRDHGHDIDTKTVNKESGLEHSLEAQFVETPAGELRPKGLHILDKNEITAENLDHHLYKQQNLRPRSKEKRNFNVGILDSLWPNGIVLYIVKHSNGASKTLITDSIEEFNKHTCVQWIPRDDQADYVSFEDGGGCGSWIGIVGGKQSITLQDPGCINVETVIHEMCHALGQLHEQSRYDRYPYLRTNWQNIPVMWAYNFDMAYTNNHNPHDQHSVLQYSLSGIAYVVQNNKCTKSAVPIKLRWLVYQKCSRLLKLHTLVLVQRCYLYININPAMEIVQAVSQLQNCYYISYEAYDSQRPAERPRGVVFGITLGIKNPSVFSVPALCKKTVVMQDIPEYQAGKFHPFV